MAGAGASRTMSVDAGVADLLVVGELCVDLIVGLTDDDIRFGQHEQLVPFTALTMGSSSAITACGAAAAGVPTTMIGVVGRDEFGDFILRELEARPVGSTSRACGSIRRCRPGPRRISRAPAATARS